MVEGLRSRSSLNEQVKSSAPGFHSYSSKYRQRSRYRAAKYWSCRVVVPYDGLHSHAHDCLKDPTIGSAHARDAYARSPVSGP